MIVPCVAHFGVLFAIEQIQFNTEFVSLGGAQRKSLCSPVSLFVCVEMYLLIRVTTVEVCDARDDDSNTVVRLRSLLVK